MRFKTGYIIKKLEQLTKELKDFPEEDDHGWEWENLLAILSRAKEQVRSKADAK